MKKDNAILSFYKKHFGIDITVSQEVVVFNTYKRESLKKREILFSQGDFNTRHYFIDKGLLRLYLIDPQGKEINVLFAKENQVIGDLATPDPTNYYLETIEDSVVYSIDEKGLQDLMRLLGADKPPDLNTVLRRSYIHIQKRLVSILSNTAEENYLEFQRKFPDLIQRLPQYHIASYLGVSPEFLSKIIAKTAKNI